MTPRFFSALRYLLLCPSLALLALFAYLGQFARMVSDDFCNIYHGAELGSVGAMQYWRAAWSGSYTDHLIIGLVAPLGTVLPRIYPALIIFLWFISLAWFFNRGLTLLQVEQHRFSLGLILSTLVLAVTINAFDSPQSIYWFVASNKYTLPLAVLTAYLAVTLDALIQPWSNTRTITITIAGAAICFMNAGFSEAYVVIQITLFALLFVSGFVLLTLWRRRNFLFVTGAGLLASCLSLVAHLSAPGVGIRANTITELYGNPERELSTLALRTFSLAVELAKDPEVIAGFLVLLGAGMFLTLQFSTPNLTSRKLESFQVKRLPLLSALTVQLLSIPLLWSHISDHPTILGRFSPSYAVILVINLALVFVLLAIVWRRPRINILLQKYRGKLLVAPIAILLILLLLFALAQFRAVQWRASIYVLASFYALLLMLRAQLSGLLPRRTAQRFGVILLLSHIIAAATIAAIVFVEVYLFAATVPRTLSFAPFFLVSLGLVWGVDLGFSIKTYVSAHPSSASAFKILKLGAVITVLIVGSGMVFGTAKQIPDFQRYAAEWDRRHQYILEARDSGQRTIRIVPLTYDFASYLLLHRLGNGSCSTAFYDVDEFVVAES